MKYCLLILIFASCNFYKPSSIYNPKIENKGDLNINGALGTSLELNTAYGVTENIGAFASFSDSYSLEYEIQDASTGLIKQFKIPNNRIDLGIGKFAVDSSNFSWNAYGGYSFGNAGTLEDFFIDRILVDDYGYRSKFNGPFIQASISSAFKKRSYLSFLGKINYLNFHDFEYTTQQQFRQLANNWNFIYQMGLEFGTFSRGVGVNLQVNYAISNGSDNYISTRNLNTNLNLFMKFNTRK